MKLAVILPTRSKPELLQTSINAFRHLASGENEIKFFVRIDSDEVFLYRTFLESKHDDTEVLMLPAPITPAEKTFDIINSQVFKDFNPEAHVLMSDDVLPLTFHWDMLIANRIRVGLDAFCWEEAGDPTNTGYIILSRKYVQAMASYLPIWFPFWFSDTWRAEVHHMAFGEPMSIVQQIKLGGKRGKTHGMQDVGFWFDFFAKTRKHRIREAKVLAENFGREFGVPQRLLDSFEAWDNAQKERCMAYETQFGGNPSARYGEAKKRAEDFLKTSLLTD